MPVSWKPVGVIAESKVQVGVFSASRKVCLLLLRMMVHLLLFLLFWLVGSSANARYWCEQPDGIGPWGVIMETKPEWPVPRPAFDSAHDYNALHYDVFIDFSFASGAFSGRTELLAVSRTELLSQVILHMVHLTADSVFFANGLRVPFFRVDSLLQVLLPTPVALGDTFALTIYYHDIAQQRGFYHYPRNSYTMSEPYDARWWFPCYDEPWDKATGALHCRVPQPIKVASNGSLLGIDTAGGYLTYHWAETKPMATYLFCLTMANYANWSVSIPSGRGDSLPCAYYVFPEDSASAAYDFGNVPAMVDIFNRLFGPYPFAKYGMAAVEPFAYGGMEHQGMTTINRVWITGTRRYEYGIAHELAHMWWGDMVTMSDFRHIWLNEGFATYAEALFAENFYGQVAFNQRIRYFRDSYFYYDEHVGRFPLFDPVQYFNAAEYFKGAWVLHMLRGIVGDSLFFAGLKHYGTTYAYGNASTEDFRDAMEAVSGLDLDYFFWQWIYEQGYPEYRYFWNYQPNGAGYSVNLEIRQVQQNSTIFTMPIQILFQSSFGDTLVTITNSQAVQSYQMWLDRLPEGLQFDPFGWVLCKAQQTTSTDSPVLVPQQYLLLPNYPNPFNQSTVVPVVFSEANEGRLEIFDISGGTVRVLHDGWLPAGRHLFVWDGSDRRGRDVAAGIYFCRLAVAQHTPVIRLILLK